LQSNEDQRGIRSEGGDEFIYPLPITEEVPPLKEIFVDLLIIIKEKTESQEHQTRSKKRFPSLAEVFHEDIFFLSGKDIFCPIFFAIKRRAFLLRFLRNSCFGSTADARLRPGKDSGRLFQVRDILYGFYSLLATTALRYSISFSVVAFSAPTLVAFSGSGILIQTYLLL